jgi:aminomethyltransferase
MTIVERFLKYVSFDTQSDDASDAKPSTRGQSVFAGYLAEELRAIGLEDISCDDGGYVMATLPGNAPRQATVGFIAHLDTSPDMPGKDVKPRIVRYEGGEILLNADLQIKMSPDTFPELNDYTGQDLIVTDGTTLLGADDKAGIAAIVSAMQYLAEHPEIAHGKVRVAFTPDEEIGRGADGFDVKRFGCDWAYTVDGGEIGELECENFNAAKALITIGGRNVHTGYAKGKMINAMLVAMELNSLLPERQRPELTDNYEGFYHLTQMNGTVEKTTLTYLIRDHDRRLFEEKKQHLLDAVRQLNGKYPGCIDIDVRDQYYNMYAILASHREIIDLAAQAMQAVGVTPRIRPVRGGTDGARLSFAGLPCPNLFAGGLNFHGRYEFLPVHSLKKSMETIIQLIKNDMKTTPFTAIHIALGAKMHEFAGYNMPIEYAGILNEHLAVCRSAGVFDVSHMGEFWVKGPRALDFIQRVTSNDASVLPVGKAQYSCFPNEKGGIVDDIIVYHYEDEKYLIVVNAANIDKDWEWCTGHNDAGAELENASDRMAQLAIQGPKAAEILQRLTPLDLAAIPYYAFKTGEFAGCPNVIISNTGYTGAGGFELYFRPEEGARIWEAIFEAGKPENIQPVGLGARDTLRLEMGYCLYGNDIDDTTSPIEAGLGWITKFAEGKNFINRDALERQKKEGVARKLCAFELTEKGIPRHGYEIADPAGRVIGAVTSGTISPLSRKGIGLGYVETAYAAAGAEIHVLIRNKALAATVVKLPFRK